MCQVGSGCKIEHTAPGSSGADRRSIWSRSRRTMAAVDPAPMLEERARAIWCLKFHRPFKMHQRDIYIPTYNICCHSFWHSIWHFFGHLIRHLFCSIPWKGMLHAPGSKDLLSTYLEDLTPVWGKKMKKKNVKSEGKIHYLVAHPTNRKWVSSPQL